MIRPLAVNGRRELQMKTAPGRASGGPLSTAAHRV